MSGPQRWNLNVPVSRDCQLCLHLGERKSILHDHAEGMARIIEGVIPGWVLLAEGHS